MRLAIHRTIQALSLCAFLLATAGDTLRGDEFQYFRNIQGGSSGTAGWDRFQGATYNTPHSADQGNSGYSGATLTVNNNGGASGLITASRDLYSFFSTPVWMIDPSGMNATLPFTSVALQVASTPDQSGAILDATDFFLNGNQADRFQVLGQFSTLTAGGGQPPQPVYYYFAAWDLLPSAPTYSVQVGPPAQNHTVLAGARLDYVNTSDSNYRITAVPEPAAAWIVATGFLAAASVCHRRRA